VDSADSVSEDLEQRLERILLGGRRMYTRLEVVEMAGVDPERVRRLWRALGFATVDDDETVFTDADVEAIRISDQLVQSGLVDPAVERRSPGRWVSTCRGWPSGRSTCC
jgi:adenylate cyclase